MALKLRIRELRDRRGWTLETLAAKAGVSVPHMSQVERGVKNLNSRVIESVAKALDVEPFELFAPRQELDSVGRLLRDLDPADLARVEAFAAALRATRQADKE